MEELKLQSDKIEELVKALVKVQGELKTLQTNQEARIPTRTGKEFRYKYADLASVWEALRRPLTENGLAITQTMLPCNGNTLLITTLYHTSGQWQRSYLPMPNETDPQKIGSIITYMRRYSLNSITGLAVEDEDDDAGSVSGGARDMHEKKEPAKEENPASDKQINKIKAQIKEFSELSGYTWEQVEKDIKKKAKIEHLNNLSKQTASKVIEGLNTAIEAEKAMASENELSRETITITNQ